MLTKSGLMLGLGEEQEEVRQAMRDLRAVGCDILTLGQYLQPTLRHLPVASYVPPSTFDDLGAEARALGFVHVASGPLVRSSYHADEVGVALPVQESGVVAEEDKTEDDHGQEQSHGQQGGHHLQHLGLPHDLA